MDLLRPRDMFSLLKAIAAIYLAAWSIEVLRTGTITMNAVTQLEHTTTTTMALALF